MPAGVIFRPAPSCRRSASERIRPARKCRDPALRHRRRRRQGGHTAADGYRVNSRQADVWYVAIAPFPNLRTARQNVGWAKRSVPNIPNFNTTMERYEIPQITPTRWQLLLHPGHPSAPTPVFHPGKRRPSANCVQERIKSNIPSPSTPSLSCPTTCTHSGACRKMTTTTQPAGAGSNAISALAVLEPMRRNRPRAITSRKNRSGNGASGNTPSAMKTIGKGTWVTSITTPSSMVTPGAPESGHTVRSSDTYKKGGIQRIGEWRSQKALKESNMNKPTWLAGQMEQGQALDVRIRKNLAKVGFDV